MPVPPDCTGCSEFNPGSIPQMIVLVILTPIITIFLISMVIKAIQRKKRVTYYLLITILLFSAAIFTSTFFNVQSWMLDYRPAWGVFVNPVLYFLLCISVYFLFLFCTEVFVTNPHRWVQVAYLVWALLAGILIILPQNNWGIAGADQTFRLIAQIHLLIFMVVTLLLQARGAFRTSRRVEGLSEKASLRIIGYGAIILVIGLFCVVGDTLTGLLLKAAGQYNIFGTLVWVFSTLGMIMLYLGYIQPGWFKKRWAS
ncbi:MAG TPA: hypothetical protein VKK79_17720 [Candidatus Lokiarchaeia archaeon]|nr:hypothetical protein [Candidatus Lokiarchaeia archaeon]